MEKIVNELSGLHEIRNYLFCFLNNTDFLNYSSVNAACRNHKEAQGRIEDIKQKTFVEEYGTIADCEADIPIEDLGFRTRAIRTAHARYVPKKEFHYFTHMNRKDAENPNIGILDFNSSRLDWATFNEVKVAKFGETTITFNGKKIPVEIVSEFGYQFDGLTYFYLKNKNTKENLGYIGFDRKWRCETTGVWGKSYKQE